MLVVTAPGLPAARVIVAVGRLSRSPSACAPCPWLLRAALSHRHRAANSVKVPELLS